MKMREIMRLVEGDDVLSKEPIGTIVTMQSAQQFGGALDYMKMSNGEWHHVDLWGGERGVPRYRYMAEPIDSAVLHKAFLENRLARPVEGIRPGGTLRIIGAQVHALPDGAVIINPRNRTSEQTYTKRDGKWFSPHGQEMPDDAFTPDNALWLK